jgi:hypothetical protein
MVTVTIQAPATGAVLPDGAQLKTLRKIVLAVHPWLSEGAQTDKSAEAEFANAFWAQSRFFRTELPDERRAFSGFLDDANATLSENGYRGVSGGAFLAACLAAGDVVWRKHEPEIGQLLTLGLCSFSGLKRNNRWLDVLSGANLLSPALPRAALVRQATATQQVSVFKQAPDGTLRIVPNGESLWTR